MENKSHAFWAGLFTVGLGLVVVVILVWFNHDRSDRQPYDLLTRLNVTGLNAGAPVRFRGLPVGRVQALRFDKASPGRIAIRIMVDSDAPVTHSTFATLGHQGVTGSSFIQLDDSGQDPAPLATSDTHVAQLPLRPGLLDDLQQRGEALLHDFSAVAQSLHEMLGPDTRKQVVRTLASVERAADGIGTLSEQARPALAQLPATLDTLNQTLASTQALLAALNDPQGPVTRNLDKIGNAAQSSAHSLEQTNRTVQTLGERLSTETLPRVNAVADDARTAMRAFDRAAAKLGSGPSRLLFGRQPTAPGPGERGFAWPAAPDPAH